MIDTDGRVLPFGLIGSCADVPIVLPKAPFRVDGEPARSLGMSHV